MKLFTDTESAEGDAGVRHQISLDVTLSYPEVVVAAHTKAEYSFLDKESGFPERGHELHLSIFEARELAKQLLAATGGV